MLFLSSTLNDSDTPLDACCRFSTPSLRTSQLDEGILCVCVCVFFFILGKLGYGDVFSSLMKGDQLSFSSHLKCRQEAIH